MGTTDVNGIKSIKYTNVKQGDTLRLLPSNFKRSGYGFLGWSTDSDAWNHYTDNDSSNNPVIYGPMETISAPPYPNSAILTLYAVWAPAEKDNNNQPVYFQDFDSQMCNNLTSTSFDSTTGSVTAGSVIALTDKRDNEVYAIARLADGNCWMIENLRLEAAGTRGNNINDNSVTNESLSQGYGKYSGSGTDYGNFIGLADAEASGFGSSDANSLYSTTTDGDKIVINTADSPSVRMPRYNHMNTYNLIDSTSYTVNYLDSSNISTSGTNYLSSNIYSYGNYYSWAAAMANTNYISTVAASEVVGTSICPDKWKLPTAGNDTSKDYNVLLRGYGSNGAFIHSDETALSQEIHKRLRAFPNNFVLAGYHKNDRGTEGHYMTSSAETNWMRTLNFDSYVSTMDIDNLHKDNAIPVRCVINNGS